MSHYTERDLRMELVRTVTVTSTAYTRRQMPISEVIPDKLNTLRTGDADLRF